MSNNFWLFAAYLHKACTSYPFEFRQELTANQRPASLTTIPITLR